MRRQHACRVDPISTHLDSRHFLLLSACSCQSRKSTTLQYWDVCLPTDSLCISSYGIPEKLDILDNTIELASTMPPKLSDNLGCRCNADLSYPDGVAFLVPFTKSRVNSLPLDNPTLQFPAF